MKSKFIIGVLLTSLILSGCGSAPAPTNTNNGETTAVQPVGNQKDEAVTIGEIIEFREDEVHVLTGDIAEIFKVSKDNMESFYLGQTVSVFKASNDVYRLEDYKVDNFDVRHTTMGNIIDRVIGEVKTVEDTAVTLIIEGTEYTYNFSDNILLEVGKTYEFDIIRYSDDDGYISNAYHENAKHVATITGIIRKESGELAIEAENANGLTYVISTYYTVKNFNLTDLEIGQTIAFYSEVMTMSIPAMVAPTRIDLLTEAVETSYDIVGEVMTINGDTVDIISGDIIETFKVDERTLQAVHLGETVKIIEQHGKYFVEPYIISDFSVHYDTMGYPIETVTGTVKAIKEQTDEKLITIEVNGEALTLNYYGEMALESDKDYEFDIIRFDETSQSITAIYDPASIIQMTVEKLERAENGELILSTKDLDGGEYTVGTSYPKKNFNISEIQPGSVINVYADAVMESWPMQVDTRKIILVRER